jgi:hypothetical protein
MELITQTEIVRAESSHDVANAPSMPTMQRMGCAVFDPLPSQTAKCGSTLWRC